MKGDIYEVDLQNPINNKDSRQAGRRPVIVVSSDIGNYSSSVVMVCPITTKRKPLSCNAEINWSTYGGKSTVLCNQIITMRKDQLQRYLGKVSYDDILRINTAMMISLGIKPNNNEVIEYDSKRQYDKKGL